MIWQIMSDKQNNLNEEDNNIQFDNATKQDQQGSDRPPVNLGTAPLKRLSSSDSRIASLTDRLAAASENDGDEKPATEKFADQPDVITPDVLQGITDDKLTSKLPRQPETSKSSKPAEKPADPTPKAEFTDKSESENTSKATEKKGKPDTGKLVDRSETYQPQKSTSGATDPTLKLKDSQPPKKEKLLELDDVPEDTSPAPDLTESSNNSDNTGAAKKPEDVPDKSDEIEFENSSEADKPVTYARRSTIGDATGKTSFLSFNKKKVENPPEKNPDTAILPEKSPSWKKVIDGQTQGTTGTIGDQREVLFVIRGMIERVVMKDNTTATLGRFDTGTVPNEEIDLIPYGAIDRGVSRRHCEILLRDNKLHVVDLGSTNGTFLAGIRLKPNEVTLLRKGDELLLGRLAVQVLFR